jgi:hypothetical protein
MSNFKYLPAVAFLAFMLSAPGAPAAPVTTLDESIVVSAREYQMRSFLVSEPLIASTRTVSVKINGQKDSEKGFDCYLMPRSDFDAFERAFKVKSEFHGLREFEGVAVRNFGGTGELKAGEYALVIVNKRNLWDPMTVRLAVSID